MTELPDVWMFLLICLAGLGFHCVFLWPGLRAEALRGDLLRLEWMLVPALSGCAAGDELAVRRMQQLLRDSRRFAGSLIFSRLILASLLLPAGSRVETARRRIEAIASGDLRDLVLKVYDGFEDAVGRRMLFGSPVLWLYSPIVLFLQLFRSEQPPRVRGWGKYVPWIELLEFTFEPGRLEETVA